MKREYPLKQVLQWMLRSMRQNRLQILLNTLIGLTDVFFSLLSVWAIQCAIDIAAHNRTGSLMQAILIMAVIIIASFMLNMGAVWVKNILGVRARNNMQQTLLSRILHSKWKGREAMHSGDVLNRLQQDVDNVVRFVTETLPDTISLLALFIGSFVYLYFMDKILAILVVLVLPIFLLLSRYYVKKMRTLSRDERESESQVQSALQESVQNSTLIKTLVSEPLMLGRLKEKHRELQQRVINRTKFSVISNNIVSIGFATGYLLAFSWSALRLFEGTLTYGGMAAFLRLVSKIQNPAVNIARIAPQFVRVITSVERLMQFEESPLEQQGPHKNLQGPCGISIENVTYAYQDAEQKTIIHNLTHNFRPGTATAILGETGSGKTTILRLILSLITPTTGNIYIYNKEEKVPVTPLTRTNFVYVPQGNTLLSGTIRDNLLLANPTATESQMRQALTQSCADFVHTLPQGLDTPFSEQGGGMSEGQAQRIAIARALLRNTPIMILDEATSALDPETEKKILQNILTTKDRTIIFITHRPAVLTHCPQTLKL